MPRKQSSARMSTLAARAMANFEAANATKFVLDHTAFMGITATEWRSLAACVMGQDETPGQAKPKKRRRK